MITMENKKRRKRSRRGLWIALSVLGLLVVGGAIYKFTQKNEVAVLLGKAEKATILERVTASGKVQPVEEVKISSEVSGEIRELYVKEGDSVKVGQLLALIRPDNLQSAVDMAQANLNTQKANLSRSKAAVTQQEAQLLQAELQYKRNQKLFADKVLSEQDYENSRATFLVAQANLKSAKETVRAAEYTVQSSEASLADARENLNLTRIYAPMAGVVTSLDVEKGERVVGTRQMAGTEMMRISNLKAMEVRVNVNENDIVRVKPGDEAIIDVDSYSYQGKKFKGTVSAIANSANNPNATSADVVTEFEVRIFILPESYSAMAQQAPFRPGMTASVDIITETRKNVLSVPLSAVTTRATKAFQERKALMEGADKQQEAKASDVQEVVFVRRPDGSVEQRPVRTGVSDFERIEIREGLKLAEEIVIGPYRVVSEELQDSTLVKPQEQDAKKKG